MIILTLFLTILNAEQNITADYLHYDRASKTSYFIGNVKMELNGGYITSDKAIHNKKNGKILFKGNVKMELKRKYQISYLSGEMIYETDTEKMVLNDVNQFELFIPSNLIKIKSKNIELELKDYKVKTRWDTKIECEEFTLCADSIICDENEIMTEKVKNRAHLEYKNTHSIIADRILFLTQKKELHFNGNVEAILKIN